MTNYKIDIYKTFMSREQVDIPADLRTSKNIEYILSKEQELREYSKQSGEECVIGIWGYPLPSGSIQGYGFHTKKEADKIIKTQQQIKYNRESLASFYFDLSWFKRKKARLRKRAFSETTC